MKSNGYFRRHTTITLRPIGRVGRAVPGYSLDGLVADIDKRIRGIRHRTQTGAYLLADPDGWVYVLKEQSPIHCKIAKARAAWIVGLFGMESNPTPDELRAAMIAHLVRIGYVTPAMIYEAIDRH